MSEEHLDTDRNSSGRFITGNPGGGRPPGSRPKLAESFVRDLQAEWARSGPAVLARLVVDDPATFARLVASVIPKDYNVTVDVDIGDFAGKFRAALEALHGDDMPVIEAKPLRMLKNAR